MAKVVKLKKTDDIAAVIQTIKDLKDREVVFELEKGSLLLTSSSNLKLMKKTGEVLGKKIRVRTDDPTGRMLAIKAEVLEGDAESQTLSAEAQMNRVRRSDIKPRFSDIVRARPVGNSMPGKQLPTVVTPSTYIAPASQVARTVSRSAEPVAAKPLRKKGSSFSKIFLVTIVVLVLAVFALAVLLPQANITVYARSEPITRDLEVTVDKSVGVTDNDKLVIPGAMVNRDVSLTKSFPTTGTKNVGTKASGEVQLYNFTKNILTLKAATTVLIVGDKKFLFTKDVTGLRPTATIGTGADAEVDPTSLIPPVGIVAQNPGEDSNIAANTKFNIVNAALGNQNVYGVDTVALSGGSTKVVKILTQADLDNAAASMTNAIAGQAEEDLKSESKDADVKILPTGVNKEVLAKTANKNVNDQVDTFDMTMIAKISGLSYKESDVKNVIKQKITSVLSDDKYLVPDADETVSANFKSLDVPNGKGVLSAHYETVAAYKVDTSNLSKILAGKDAEGIKQILLSKPEIDRVDVEFSPFFVNKAPKLNGKIHIEQKLSN
jgi:cell division protein FtsL